MANFIFGIKNLPMETEQIMTELRERSSLKLEIRTIIFWDNSRFDIWDEISINSKSLETGQNNFNEF